jgi:hypothetical protein
MVLPRENKPARCLRMFILQLPSADVNVRWQREFSPATYLFTAWFSSSSLSDHPTSCKHTLLCAILEVGVPGFHLPPVSPAFKHRAFSAAEYSSSWTAVEADNGFVSRNNFDPLRDEELRSLGFEPDLPSLEADFTWSVTDLTPTIGVAVIESTGRRGVEVDCPPSQIPRTP